MCDLNYFHLGYQDATEINLPAAWMNWLPTRGTDSTCSSPLTKSCWNNQNRPGQNANGRNIQTITDADRKRTPGHKMPEANWQEGNQEEIEVWKPVRIMLAMHRVPWSKPVLPTKCRGWGFVEYTWKDGCSPPTRAQNSATQTRFFGLRGKKSSKWRVIETLFITAIIRKQSPWWQLPLTGRVNYDGPIQWDPVIPLSPNCVTVTPTYKRKESGGDNSFHWGYYCFEQSQSCLH